MGEGGRVDEKGGRKKGWVKEGERLGGKGGRKGG